MTRFTLGYFALGSFVGSVVFGNGYGMIASAIVLAAWMLSEKPRA